MDIASSNLVAKRENLHFAYYLLPEVLQKLVDFMNSLEGST